MKCPVCNIELVINERQGIEIDYCPTCRGVWLDRGELDKIIERTQTAFKAVHVPSVSHQKEDDYEVTYEGPKEYKAEKKYYKKRKKPKRILKEIFDIFD